MYITSLEGVPAAELQSGQLTLWWWCAGKHIANCPVMPQGSRTLILQGTGVPFYTDTLDWGALGYLSISPL